MIMSQKGLIDSLEETQSVGIQKRAPRVGQAPGRQPDFTRKPRPATWLCISVALIAAGGFGACLIQTDFGKIDIIGLKFPTQNGQWVAADLFKPRSANATNQVPIVVVCPGFERSKETMSGYSIELARRGIAVIAIDPY